MGREDCEEEFALALLNAPWEVLASNGEFWALQASLAFCPIRRIGKAATPAPPSADRLGLVFMAAAPRGADSLNYEAEEIAILKATHSLRLDLVVEESGTLDLLSACVAREKPEVIQISCHGTFQPQPGLLLEDEFGNEALVTANDLVTRLAAQHPRLLFVSACATAQADPVLPSLALSLVMAGAPAVLGWAASVRDDEATLFAALFYKSLTQGDDLGRALANARQNMDEMAPFGSRDWHLARLFLSPDAGGALAMAGGRQRHPGQEQVVKTLRKAKGRQLSVASEREFVGRRREIRAILREFDAPLSERHAGVFIHGVGGQGKSRLAARVAHRLECTHETVVIFGRYDAPFILRTLGKRLAMPAATEIVKHHAPLVKADEANLLPALTELLEGPCAQTADHGARPVLLVLDQFEQALNERDRRTLKPEYFDSIRALLLAFDASSTESLLLFTCRFQFTCPHHGRDLADADHLLDVPLHGMNEDEAEKQAQTKRRQLADARSMARQPQRKWCEEVEKRLDRAITNARGNPGLQDLLFTLANEDPAACDRCLAQMEKFHRSSKVPATGQVRAFLEDLDLQSLTGLLSPAQREFLRASTLFEVPVPLTAMRTLAEKAGLGAVSSGGEGARGTGEGAANDALSRLVALGLWEVYEDLQDPQALALALNALVRPLAGTLSEAEKAGLAGAVTGVLFGEWGGETGGKQRRYLQDHELTRLGMLARDARVLTTTGADGLHFLASQFKWRQAAAWAKEIVAIVDAAGLSASMRLLRTAAKSCHQVGELAEANAFRERAMKLPAQGGEADTEEQANLLITHAQALMEQGQPDEALRYLERAKGLTVGDHTRAIVISKVASIRNYKGEVDEALRLYEEARDIHKVLRNKPAWALCLLDIARIRVKKGEVDVARRLHEETRDIFTTFGDKHSQAVLRCDIASIEASKGNVDVARVFYKEALEIFEALGDKLGRGVCLRDIASIETSKGKVDVALGLHKKALHIFERLGHKYEKANTLLEIARCEIRQQKWRGARDHLVQSCTIYANLGYPDAIFEAGLVLGDFLCRIGKRKRGLAILTTAREGFLELGRRQLAQQAQSLIDQASGK
ncbi:MAG: tetratricopeptide repeat protein [Polyangia bacterium]